MTRLTGVEENMDDLTETEMSQEQRAMSQEQHEMSKAPPDGPVKWIGLTQDKNVSCEDVVTRLKRVEEYMEKLTANEMSQEQRAMSQKQHEMSLEQREITENVTKLLTKVEEMYDIQNQNTNDTKRLQEDVRTLQMAIKRKSLGLV